MSYESKESLEIILAAHQQYAAPDELVVDNVSSSMDAQLAVNGFKAVIEAKRLESEQTRWNQTLVRTVLDVLPGPERDINIHDPNDLSLARQIQSHAIFGFHGFSGASYIAGSRHRGRVTDLLLLDSPNYSDGIPADYLYSVKTKDLTQATSEAELRKAKPLTAEELRQMRWMDDRVRLDQRVDSSMRLATKPYPFGSNPIQKAQHLFDLRTLPVYSAKGDSAIRLVDRISLVEKVGDKNPYGVGLNNCVMEEFGVLNHLAELAIDLGCSEEAKAAIQKLHAI